jgi:hypothetical protein
MGMAGCKLAIAANSNKIDFDSLRELLIELLPVLSSAILLNIALETIRRDIEEIIGEKIDEVRPIAEELLSSDLVPTRSQTTASSPIDHLHRLRIKTHEMECYKSAVVVPLNRKPARFPISNTTPNNYKNQ